MREYGMFKWKLRGTYRVEQMSDTQLKRFQPKVDHEYFNAESELRRLRALVSRANMKARNYRLIRIRIRSEVGRRKAVKCPCHILTGKKGEGSVLCLARKRNWDNIYHDSEFYFWICSSCKMGDDYKAKKALVNKLTGEYKKHVVDKFPL